MAAVDHPLPQLARATVTRHAVGRRSVLAVGGEIDIDTAPALAAAVERELAAGATELWVDLTATTFMDSSGVHVLFGGHHRAVGLTRRLAVICPAGNVRRVLELVGVVDHVPVFADRAAAH